MYHRGSVAGQGVAHLVDLPLDAAGLHARRDLHDLALVVALVLDRRRDAALVGARHRALRHLDHRLVVIERVSPPDFGRHAACVSLQQVGGGGSRGRRARKPVAMLDVWVLLCFARLLFSAGVDVCLASPDFVSVDACRATCSGERT